jgi:hypothetical protein
MIFAFFKKGDNSKEKRHRTAEQYKRITKIQTHSIQNRSKVQYKPPLGFL